jgi:hypothetical protein
VIAPAPERREVVPPAARAHLLVVANLVLDLPRDELALLLGVLAPRLEGREPVGLGARGIADRLRDRRHLLGPLPEDVALQLLERPLHRRELLAHLAELAFERLRSFSPFAATIVSARP